LMDLNLYVKEPLTEAQEGKEFEKLEKVLQEDLKEDLKSGDAYSAIVQWSKNGRIPNLYNVRVSVIYNVLSEIEREQPQARLLTKLGLASTTGLINPPPPPPPPPRIDPDSFFKDSPFRPFELSLDPIRTIVIESKIAELQAFKQ